MSTTTTQKPATNGTPGGTDLPRSRGEIKTEIAAIRRQANDKIEAEKEAKQRELAYLRSLLAHPAADMVMSERVCLLNQATMFDGCDPDELVGTLVLVEAFKALREKAELPE